MSQENSKSYKKAELSDNREVGNWESKYSWRAWVQILAELTYLVVLLSGCIVLVSDGLLASKLDPATDTLRSSLLGVEVNTTIAKWVALALSGMIGGIVFDLKWLYHSVAYNIWNCDRVLWRISVPIMSAMVSLFTGFLFASGLIPFLKDEPFENTYTLLGCGFVFGYFSDNILAALQNFARRIFGTLESKD